MQYARCLAVSQWQWVVEIADSGELRVPMAYYEYSLAASAMQRS